MELSGDGIAAEDAQKVAQQALDLEQEVTASGNPPETN